MSNNPNEINIDRSPLTERRTYRFLIRLGLLGLFASLLVSFLVILILPSYIEAIVAENLSQIMERNMMVNMIHSADGYISCLIAIGFYGLLVKIGNRLSILFAVLSFDFCLYLLYTVFDSLLSIVSQSYTFVPYLEPILRISISIVLGFVLWRSRFSISNRTLLYIVIILLMIVPLVNYSWWQLSEGLRTNANIPYLPAIFYTEILYCMPAIIPPILYLIAVIILFLYELRTDDVKQ